MSESSAEDETEVEQLRAEFKEADATAARRSALRTYLKRAKASGLSEYDLCREFFQEVRAARGAQLSYPMPPYSKASVTYRAVRVRGVPTKRVFAALDSRADDWSQRVSELAGDGEKEWQRFRAEFDAWLHRSFSSVNVLPGFWELLFDIAHARNDEEREELTTKLRSEFETPNNEPCGACRIAKAENDRTCDVPLDMHPKGVVYECVVCGHPLCDHRLPGYY